MLYQIIITCGLLLFLVNLLLNLKNMKRPDINSRIPDGTPLISVLIPARDEEANIERCLKSLQAQDYPAFEILVLDDNSRDRTAEIVARLAEGDKRIRLLHGEPLPSDWMGKCFACDQLARQASGAWLLFVDADTIHEPGMLRGVVDLAVRNDVTLLSGFPRQLADTLPLKIIQPIQYYIILGWLPVWLLHKLGKPSLAIGQFMFFNAAEYWRIGGHEAVKAQVVEDVCLGIEVGKHHGRHLAVDLSPVAATKMYVDVGDAWRGFAKSIQAIVAMNPLGIFGLIIAATLFYLGPFWWVWRGIIAGNAPPLWRDIVFLQVAVILFMQWLVASRFREPMISVLLSPLGLAFYVLNVIYSTFRWLVGAGVTWKERVYGGESVIK